MRCQRCNGLKRITGMGFIEGDCPNCDGNGYAIESSKKIETLADVPDAIEIPAKRKYERKAKQELQVD